MFAATAPIGQRLEDTVEIDFGKETYVEVMLMWAGEHAT